jgi:hypothetical protein
MKNLIWDIKNIANACVVGPLLAGTTTYLVMALVGAVDGEWMLLYPLNPLFWISLFIAATFILFAGIFPMLVVCTPLSWVLYRCKYLHFVGIEAAVVYFVVIFTIFSNSRMIADLSMLIFLPGLFVNIWAYRTRVLG